MRSMRRNRQISQSATMALSHRKTARTTWPALHPAPASACSAMGAEAPATRAVTMTLHTRMGGAGYLAVCENRRPMRKIVVHRAGGYEALRLEEHPDPSPGRGEVLVATEAVGVNYADCLVRMGLYE